MLQKKKIVNRHRTKENEDIRQAHNKRYADARRQAIPGEIKIGDYVVVKATKNKKNYFEFQRQTVQSCTPS